MGRVCVCVCVRVPGLWSPLILKYEHFKHPLHNSPYFTLPPFYSIYSINITALTLNILTFLLLLPSASSSLSLLSAIYYSGHLAM